MRARRRPRRFPPALPRAFNLPRARAPAPPRADERDPLPSVPTDWEPSAASSWPGRAQVGEDGVGEALRAAAADAGRPGWAAEMCEGRERRERQAERWGPGPRRGARARDGPWAVLCCAQADDEWTRMMPTADAGRRAQLARSCLVRRGGRGAEGRARRPSWTTAGLRDEGREATTTTTIDDDDGGAFWPGLDWTSAGGS